MPAGSAPRRLRLPVPVSILTGALASGKTTAIASLLRQKPAGEVWAVLVNEFGAAGLDAALLEGGAAGPADVPPAAETATAGAAAAAAAAAADGVHIKQLAGGCLCCALSSVTAVAIAQLLRSVKPDRLVIEPSGLAHPAALLDMLQGGHLGPSLALQPVVCLVDATQFAGGAAAPACMAHQLLADQVAVADVLVGSKADLCDEAALHAFHAWAAELFPPKRLVATARRGQLDAATAAALLAWPANSGSGSGGGGGSSSAGDAAGDSAPSSTTADGLPLQRPRRGAASTPWLSSSPAAGAAAEEQPTLERPLRQQVQGADGAHAACGWVFHRDCVFSRQRLLELLPLLVAATLRVKAVLRVGAKTWVAVSAAPAHMQDPATAAVAAAAAEATPAAAAASAAAAAAAAAVELVETAYRRDSRVEVIIDVAACRASGASSSSSSLEQQAAAGGDTAQRVAAALRQAAAGDWAALEALLMGALQDA